MREKVLPAVVDAKTACSRAISAVEYGVLGPFSSNETFKPVGQYVFMVSHLTMVLFSTPTRTLYCRWIHHTFKSQADVVAMWSIESLYEERITCEDMCICAPDSLFLSYQILNFLPNYRLHYRSFCFHVPFFSQ